jgi:hypothetical protein
MFGTPAVLLLAVAAAAAEVAPPPNAIGSCLPLKTESAETVPGDLSSRPSLTLATMFDSWVMRQVPGLPQRPPTKLKIYRTETTRRP